MKHDLYIFSFNYFNLVVQLIFILGVGVGFFSIHTIIYAFFVHNNLHGLNET